jgi:hypothetical protein
MHLPGAVLLRGDTGRAGIEEIQRLVHRLTHGPAGRGAHMGAVLPGGIDGAGKVGMGHEVGLSELRRENGLAA